ncbi:hypothetical protein D3C71_2101250 [compost metagenome]
MATAPEMLKSVSGIDLDKLVKGLINRGDDKPTKAPASQAEPIVTPIVTPLKPEA